MPVNENNVMQIRINHKLIGVVGLKQVMEEMAGRFASQSDAEIGAEIIKRLSHNNYIPDRAGDVYELAFIHEFRKYLCQSVDDPPEEELCIAVLGAGCSQCGRMEMDVREVMAEMKLVGELMHVSDPREIGMYGVMGVPALVINGRVVCVGQLPHRSRIKEWLRQAVEKNGTS